MALYLIDNIINSLRFILGLILVVIAMRAFLKTRTSDMLYLVMGFTLITVGNAFSAIYYFNDVHMDALLSDIFDIFGLIALIIAIKKG
jgi:hypothetical protein